MSERRFENVWYLPSENKGKDYRPIAFRDTGELVISEGEIRFRGKKWAFSIPSIRRISFGKQGWDFVNKWVKVEYEGGVAFFADGSAFGWGGFLGGNKKLYSVLKQIRTS